MACTGILCPLLLVNSIPSEEKQITGCSSMINVNAKVKHVAEYSKSILKLRA